jgi:hypothetical protein
MSGLQLQKEGTDIWKSERIILHTSKKTQIQALSCPSNGIKYDNYFFFLGSDNDYNGIEKTYILIESVFCVMSIGC